MDRRTINPGTWQDQYAFSQAIEVTNGQRVLFCAGQTSNDPNGAPVHAGDMAAQIGQAFDNLEEVLSTAGMRLSDVVRLNYYTTDMDAFFGAHHVVQSRLAAAGCQPSSTLLGVTRLAFPELLVEIEATAVA